MDIKCEITSEEIAALCIFLIDFDRQSKYFDGYFYCKDLGCSSEFFELLISIKHKLLACLSLNSQIAAENKKECSK